MIDPNDFVITRKRKKYRFAKFANSPLCFELDDWPKAKDVDVIEVGAGTAMFSVRLAERHPDKRFVAIDVKADRLQKGAYEAEALGLTNVRFLRARADQLNDCFTQHSLQTIWLTFADPFPKKGSAGRRMSHPTYLTIYGNLLSPHGSFLLKHDSSDFFNWSLEQLVAEKWHIQELSFDLHESDLSDDYKITTSYEERWQDEGRRTNFVAAQMIK
ncbi:MAG: tRNA (guanosine(46)-N7)-methyltransferase TrmB [Patescibacteria group bacterium]